MKHSTDVSTITVSTTTSFNTAQLTTTQLTTAPLNTHLSNNGVNRCNKKLPLLIAAISLAAAGFTSNANAGHRHAAVVHKHVTYTTVSHKHTGWDYAKVTAVEPIYRSVSRSVPREQCWVETVRVDHGTHHSHTGAVVGGVVGAAIGNSVTRNSHHRPAGTVAGAIVGAAIGADISAKNRSHHDVVSEYRDVERCKTTYVTEYEQRLIGYDVNYLYHGRSYQTRTDEHPGKRIKVAVSVRPTY